MRNQSCFMGLTKETTDGVAALVSVVEGPMIHIHANELICQLSPHIAGEIEGVLNRFWSVIKAVLDALSE